jgi:nicotinamide phosphoribosyltransferase
MKKLNLILMADAYKYSHAKLYYPGTNKVYSYLESRGGKFDNTVFYGLQYFITTYLMGEAITQQDLDEADILLKDVFGRDDVFDKTRFQYIIDKYQGRLPVKIKAVPEGMAVPTGNVLMTIENTDPECYWLPNFLETLLMQVWYPSTVATLSREVKNLLYAYYEQTASEGSEAGIEYVLNDFGFRGVSNVESAALGGSAHLISFKGSDTIQGSILAKCIYGAKEMYGKSIPATEHSICTLLGEEGEKEVFRHILQSFPEGIVACVSDSYDILRACEKYWGEEFKDEILARNGTLVIRPDSGDPVTTLLSVFRILFDKFGFTVNEKGYKVLPPQVRVIQGDGVNFDAIKEIFAALEKEGISAENLVLGMGGALLQKVDRDTQKFAMKCSYAEINEKALEVQKRPKELDEKGRYQESFKTSKAGKLKLVRFEQGLATVSSNANPELPDILETVFEDGELVRKMTFEEIRANAVIAIENVLV